MGVVESGRLPVYQMRRHPSQSGRPHLQSEVRQSGHVDTRTSSRKYNCTLSAVLVLMLRPQATILLSAIQTCQTRTNRHGVVRWHPI